MNFDMKQDWEENHKTDKFKYDMTPCYLPESTSLAPCGYRILVITDSLLVNY